MLLLLATAAGAQVKYEDATGGVVEMTFEQQEGGLFLCVKTDSESSRMVDPPTIAFSLVGDEVMALTGSIDRYDSGTDRFSLSGLTITSQRQYSYARFAIAPEQVERIGQGVVRIQIAMQPYANDCKWRKDKIGRKLLAWYHKVVE